MDAVFFFLDWCLGGNTHKVIWCKIRRWPVCGCVACLPFRLGFLVPFSNLKLRVLGMCM